MTKFELIPTEIVKVNQQQVSHENDLLSVEEPLEIVLLYFYEGQWLEKKLSVVMRTPGFDENLVIGFLYTEGIIRDFEDIIEVKFAESTQVETPLNGNRVFCKLKQEIIFDIHSVERHFYTTSSCGVCGKASIDAVKIACPIIVPQNKWKISYRTVYKFNERLRENQKNFNFSGGIHASAFFDLGGNLLYLREDVGRHNALDKAIGEALKQGIIPLFDVVLFLSGRVSFELIQKASMAGIRMICAVGAPSSLAVDLAQELDITLVGFLRENRFNVYSAIERLDFEDEY
jgi:FdhD protein